MVSMSLKNLSFLLCSEFCCKKIHDLFDLYVNSLCCKSENIPTLTRKFQKGSINCNVFIKNQWSPIKKKGAIMVMIVWYLDLQLSVPITTKVVSSNSAHGKMYSIQHYVLNFFSDLQQVSGFLWFPPPIKWLPWYNWNTVESGIKHHYPQNNKHRLFSHVSIVGIDVFMLLKMIKCIQRQQVS